ncbi:aromatic ring-hydroxylating dioxygenase subunit alpha [Azospirillum sp. TSA2s]|uniref:aromatic ring-hydroxylating dioxygenase subunit alpha n=1 Tax=Azospirillum sp. TSA2s TaxID=709810 RepID=UPI0010AA73C3|nr:aromatic ring-hydroxylating dioxygenase subunit alpha [Azospirillum sp. TSA2s]QCG95812.1 aromatic ring-hydroxylating dioxygenase subunit alpha [Azospirillum sp. TSA2s]
MSSFERRLSDGTRIEDLIDVDTREVRVRTLADAELHQIEMERIFGKVWQLLGHESEIPNPNDFMIRALGEDSVLVARDRNGEIHVTLNVCPHRAMRVCRSDAGNAPTHRCPYHGWAFRPDGAFIGSPVGGETMHGKLLDKKQLSLKKARVTLYGGLIFATWNIDGPSLDEFLGEMKWYFDMLFDRTDKGLEALGPPQRFVLRANWKSASEQSASDGFHAYTLHEWLGQLAGFGSGDLTSSMLGVEVTSKLGHSLRCMPMAQKFERGAALKDTSLSLAERLEILAPPGIIPSMAPELERHLSTEQIEQLLLQPPQVGNIFPNLIIEHVYVPQPGGKPLGLFAVHTYMPRGVDKMEFVNWLLAEKDTPQEMKDAMRKMGVRMLGTSGMIEQDDSDPWLDQAVLAKGAQARNITLKYQAIHNPERPSWWVGPAEVYEGFTKDDTQWNWWLQWRDLMLNAG